MPGSKRFAHLQCPAQSPTVPIPSQTFLSPYLEVLPLWSIGCCLHSHVTGNWGNRTAFIYWHMIFTQEVLAFVYIFIFLFKLFVVIERFIHTVKLMVTNFFLSFFFLVTNSFHFFHFLSFPHFLSLPGITQVPMKQYVCSECVLGASSSFHFCKVEIPEPHPCS